MKRWISYLAMSLSVIAAAAILYFRYRYHFIYEEQFIFGSVTQILAYPLIFSVAAGVLAGVAAVLVSRMFCKSMWPPCIVISVLDVVLLFLPGHTQFERLDCLVREQKWDEVVESYRDNPDEVSILDLAYLNLALAERGELAERAFEYNQIGIEGLYPEWGQNNANGTVLSELYFSMGHIAMAQRLAFETEVNSKGKINPRMLRRLMQTNAIYGAYGVVRKYAGILEAYPHYRGLAEQAGEESLYEVKRACLPERDLFSEADGLDKDLRAIIRANPAHRATIEYLGLMCLLDRDFESFKSVLDEFYGTGALPSLPRSFREAVILISDDYPGLWKRCGVDVRENRLYRDFVQRLSKGLSVDRYKDTYWYYLLKSKSV